MSQTMKASTAAAKLGIYLPATPQEFQDSTFTRDQLEELRTDPPHWLRELRKNGPFPRDVVASKLGVSRSGLARNGIKEALDAEQIKLLVDNPPEWLVKERESLLNVIAEKEKQVLERLHGKIDSRHEKRDHHEKRSQHHKHEQHEKRHHDAHDQS